MQWQIRDHCAWNIIVTWIVQLMVFTHWQNQLTIPWKSTSWNLTRAARHSEVSCLQRTCIAFLLSRPLTETAHTPTLRTPWLSSPYDHFGFLKWDTAFPSKFDVRLVLPMTMVESVSVTLIKIQGQGCVKKGEKQNCVLLTKSYWLKLFPQDINQMPHGSHYLRWPW